MNLPINAAGKNQRLYIFHRRPLLPQDKTRATIAEMEDLRSPLDLSRWEPTLNHLQRKLRTLRKWCREHVPFLGFFLFPPSERFLEWHETVLVSEILPTPETLLRLNEGEPAPVYFLPLLREVLKRPYYQKNAIAAYRAVMMVLISRDFANHPTEDLRRVFRALMRLDDLMEKCEPLSMASSYLFAFEGPVTVGLAQHLFILYSYFELLVGFAFGELEEVIRRYRRMKESVRVMQRLVM